MNKHIAARKRAYFAFEADEWRIKCAWCSKLDRDHKETWAQKDKRARYRRYVDYAPVCSVDGASVVYNQYRNCEDFDKLEVKDGEINSNSVKQTKEIGVKHGGGKDGLGGS